MSTFVSIGDIGELKRRISTRLEREDVSQSQMDYERILQDIADIRATKVREYGEQAYENEDEELDLWERFIDVKRKFMRLQELTKLVLSGDMSALPSLVDGYRDIANYGIMGVQVMQKYFPKQPLAIN